MNKSTWLVICGLILLLIAAFREYVEIHLFSGQLSVISMLFTIGNLVVAGIAGVLFGMALDD